MAKGFIFHLPSINSVIMSEKKADVKQDFKLTVNGDGDKQDGDKSNHSKTSIQNDNNFQQQQRRQLATSTSLFVTGLAHAINKTHIERLFSKFGTTERISEFMTSQKSTSSARYCFVEYDSIESAQKAMDSLNGRTLLHKRLVVLPAHTRTDDDSSSGRKINVRLNPKKERILIDKKIEALKKKIKESQGD